MLLDRPHCPTLPASVRHIAENMPLVLDHYGLRLEQEPEATHLVVANERSNGIDVLIAGLDSALAGSSSLRIEMH
jgi:hypothetical protein